MPDAKKKKLSKVPIVLADDKARELLYTLEEVYEISKLRDLENPTDPRHFARIVQLGLRHAEPDLTVEQVARLIDAPNLDYYNACVAEAAYQGDNPTSAVPQVNGVAAPQIGASSLPGAGSTSGLGKPISGV